MTTYSITIHVEGVPQETSVFSTTFESPADTLTLARTVVEAIQSIPEPPKPRRTRSDAGKTRGATV